MGYFRLCLAIVVALFHTGLGGGAGPFSVMMFYVLSGYIISKVINERYSLENNFAIKFILARFLKLFPIMLVVSIMAFCLHSFFKISGYGLYTFDIKSFLTTFLPTTNFEIKGFCLRLYTYFELIPQFWSVGVEFIFYIIAPIIFIFKNKLKTALTLFIVTFIYYLYIAYSTYTDYQEFLNFIYRNVLANFFFFFYGSTVYFVKHKFKVRFNKMIFYSSSIAFSALIYFSYTSLAEFVSNLSINFMIWQVLILIFAFFILFSYQNINSKADMFCGNLSYPLYVSHIFVLECINTVYGYFNIKSGYEKYFFVAIVSIFISIILLRIVELPLLKIRNRILDLKNN